MCCFKAFNGDSIYVRCKVIGGLKDTFWLDSKNFQKPGFLGYCKNERMKLKLPGYCAWEVDALWELEGGKNTSRHTVLTFNSCTKCMGSPSIIKTAHPKATQFPGHGYVDDLITERRFDLQATQVVVLLCLFFWHVIHGCLYNQALADDRSPRAGIKCLLLYAGKTLRS